MEGIVKQTNKEEIKKFRSELTDTLAEHYLETGKTFFWNSVIKEDNTFPEDFATQLRRAEMHGEIYVKKIAGDWKICLTKKTLKGLGERNVETIFMEACIQENKGNAKIARLSRTSVKILMALNEGPRQPGELAVDLKIPLKDLCARLLMLKKHQYVKKDFIYWNNTAVGEFVAKNPPRGV